MPETQVQRPPIGHWGDLQRWAQDIMDALDGRYHAADDGYYHGPTPDSRRNCSLCKLLFGGKGDSTT